MTGLLKIHCITAGGSRLGHSWIEYCPIDGQPHTYSTWGNQPEDGENGLLVDKDFRYHSDVSRSYILDAEQETRLMERIEHYRQLGGDAWQLLAPCSAFAADVWQSATGEALVHRLAYISTPGILADSVRQANSNEKMAAPATAMTTKPRQAPSKQLKRRHRSVRRR